MILMDKPKNILPYSFIRYFKIHLNIISEFIKIHLNIISEGTCGSGKTKTPSSMITVEIKDVLGVYFLVGGGVVLGFIFLLFECLYFTRKVVHCPDTVS